MKSISFDQIKTMLKSMSLTLFKRIGSLEDKVNPPDKPPNKMYVTDENGVARWQEKAFILPCIYVDYKEITNVTNPKPKAWKDAAQTAQLTFDEGLHILLQGGMITSITKNSSYQPALYIETQPYNKTILVLLEENSVKQDGSRSNYTQCVLQFSDSNNDN